MARHITIERFHDLLASNIASGGVVSDNEGVLVDTIETARKNIITEISNKGGKIAGSIGGGIVGGGIGKDIGDKVGEKLGELAGKVWGSLFDGITGKRDGGLERTDFYVDAPGYVHNGLNISANGMMALLKDTHFFITGSRTIKNSTDIDNYVHFNRSDNAKQIERNRKGWLTMGHFEDLLINMPLYNTEEDYQHYKDSKDLAELVKFTNGAIDLTYKDYLDYMVGKYGLATDRTMPFINKYGEIAGSSFIDDMIKSMSSTGTLSAPKKGLSLGLGSTASSSLVPIALGALGFFLLKKK